jgi:hypothetical protein
MNIGEIVKVVQVDLLEVGSSPPEEEVEETPEVVSSSPTPEPIGMSPAIH